MSEIISYPLGPDLSTDAAGQAYADRAGAHAAAESALRAAQRWQHGVTDLAVARVVYALERGTRPYRNRSGRWYAPTGSPLAGMGQSLSTVINEMVRTGIVRHWRDREGDHLIPAPVHLLVKDIEAPAGAVLRHSACLFVGEDMGPMRARLIDQLALVDCGNCEQAICTGTIRAGWRA